MKNLFAFFIIIGLMSLLSNHKSVGENCRRVPAMVTVNSQQQPGFEVQCKGKKDWQTAYLVDGNGNEIAQNNEAREIIRTQPRTTYATSQPIYKEKD